MDYLKIQPFLRWEDSRYIYLSRAYNAEAIWLYFMYIRTKEKQWMNTTSEKELIIINIPAFCLN